MVVNKVLLLKFKYQHCNVEILLGPHLRTRCSPFFGPTPKSGDVSAFIIVTVDFELELGTLKSHGRSVAGVHSFVLS